MYKLIRNIEDLEFEINESKPIFCDTETCLEEGKSDGGLYGAIRLFQVYQEGWKEAKIIDCWFIPLSSILQKLQNGRCVFHNASYDLHTINCHTQDLWLPRRLDDTMYLSKLSLFDKTSKFSFYECLEAAGVADDTIRSIDKKANQKADWGGVLTKTMLEYAAYDVLYLWMLYDQVKRAEDTESYKLDIFNLKYAIEYDRRGIPVNQVEVIKRLKESTLKLEEVLEELPVNPNSPKQCCELLKSKSSSSDTLQLLKLQGNEVAGRIADARSLTKTVNFLKKYSRPVIRGFHNPAGAISGRFTCKGGHRFGYENLQQIPRLLLDCLEAPEGYVFVYKDYPGLELRMAVVWIAEPIMENLLRQGIDLHTYTACALFDTSEENLTKEQRLVGKICNFLLIYGGGIKVLQIVLRQRGGLLKTFAECKYIRSTWFELYPTYEVWHNMVRKHLNIYGYLDVSTALGRQVRTTSINDAVNVPIQGSSAEVTKVSLRLLKEGYSDENLINTIHDSNTLLVKEDRAQEWVNNLNYCMVEAWNIVTKDLAINDLKMPAEASANKVWRF